MWFVLRPTAVYHHQCAVLKWPKHSSGSFGMTLNAHEHMWPDATHVPYVLVEVYTNYRSENFVIEFNFECLVWSYNCSEQDISALPFQHSPSVLQHIQQHCIFSLLVSIYHCHFFWIHHYHNPVVISRAMTMTVDLLFTVVLNSLVVLHSAKTSRACMSWQHQYVMWPYLFTVEHDTVLYFGLCYCVTCS